MRYLFTTLLLITIPFILSAQNLGLPEQQKTGTLAERDSMRIQVLLNKGLSLVNEHTDSAMLLLQEARKLSEQHRYARGIALSLVGLSSCFAVDDDIVTANKYLALALPYCKGSDHLMIRWYRNQFIVHKYAGQTDSGMAVLQRVAPLLDRLKDTFYAINMYNHIGSLLIDNQDYGSALIYVRKAIARNHKFNADLLVSYVNLGYIYASQQQTDSMYYWALKAYNGAKQLQQARYERSASLLLVKYYLAKGNKKEADSYAQNAIHLADKKVSDNQLYVYRVLSLTYKEYKEYDKALEYGTTALQYLKPQQSLRKDVIHLYATLADIHHAQGNSGQAYELLRLHNRLSDSMNLLERNMAMDKLEKQFRLSEKEKEIAVKENQILLQENKVSSRNIWIVGMGGGGLSIATLLLLYYRNARRKLNMLHQQKEIDELQAMIDGEEKERNRIAVELHDNVGGMLSAAVYSIEAFKSQHDNAAGNDAFQKIDGIINEVRNEIRKTAHTLMPDVLLRHSLYEAVNQYCSFIESDTGLQIDMQHQGQSDALPKDIQLALYRIVQELIQNILKHAKATHAIVQLHSGRELLSLTVEDNGCGFDSSGYGNGRGLQHIESRLRVINGKISIDSGRDKGTSVYIELILNSTHKKS